MRGVRVWTGWKGGGAGLRPALGRTRACRFSARGATAALPPRGWGDGACDLTEGGGVAIRHRVGRRAARRAAAWSGCAAWGRTV